MYIMLATRILGYGKDYVIETEDEMGEKESITVDLSKIQTKEVSFEKLNQENKYQFTTSTGVVIEYKFLSHGDEKKIDEDIRALQRLNKGGVSAELTTRYRHMIISVDGKDDTKSISDFINNKFLTKDTSTFRKELSSLQPDVVMEYEYDNEVSGEKEKNFPNSYGCRVFLAYRLTTPLYFINKFLNYVTMVMDSIKKEFIDYLFISETSTINN